MAKRKYMSVVIESDKAYVYDRYDKLIVVAKTTDKEGNPLKFDQDGSIKTNPIIIDCGE